jgi:hypothetical protein
MSSQVEVPTRKIHSQRQQVIDEEKAEIGNENPQPRSNQNEMGHAHCEATQTDYRTDEEDPEVSFHEHVLLIV